jgi:uncharacterized membrane protein
MDDDELVRSDERLHDPSRVLALSDGVFAIILTLLVLEIHLPEFGPGQTLVDAMRTIRPSFTAFPISFVVVAIAWAGHRDLFALIRRTDRPLVWLNILYLLPLSILPFGASLIANYEAESVALRLYGFLLVAIGASRLAIWMYATRRPRLLYSAVDRQSRRAGVAIVAVPGVAYAIAILVAAAAPTASLVIYAAVPAVYFIGITIARTSGRPGSAEQDFT